VKFLIHIVLLVLYEEQMRSNNWRW